MSDLAQTIMKERKPLSKADQENLVAFLDGELRGEAARQVEARIVADKNIRSEADALKQVWDLLDYLPRSEPSVHFTQTTMQRLPTLHQSWLARLLPIQDRGQVLAWAAGLLLAFGAGFVTYRFLGGRASLPGEAQLTRELRLIENKSSYEIGVSVKFLQELDQPDLFGADPSDT